MGAHRAYSSRSESEVRRSSVCVAEDVDVVDEVMEDADEAHVSIVGQWLKVCLRVCVCVWHCESVTESVCAWIVGQWLKVCVCVCMYGIVYQWHILA